MNRTDYAYAPLTYDQYATIIAAGEIFSDGHGRAIASPLRGEANWDAAERQARAGDVDQRVLLAALLMEDHFGTDPNGGVALAAVYNFAGIKWAGQAGAYDSGIPCPPNEGGTYAGFADFGGFVAELIATLNNQYCGPWFRAGDLANAWSVYVKGRVGDPAGQSRVDQWQYYRAHYPPANAPPVAQGVYGEDLIATFRTQIGHPRSGDYDVLNGDHPWAYWCEAGAESTGRNCGLAVIPRASALDKYNHCLDQGLIQQGTPEHGGQVFFGLAFYSPDGHTGLWDADKGMLLCTLTDGTGVGYRDWGPNTVGYLGWCRVPGVVGDRRAIPSPPPPPVPANYVPAGNPYNAGRVPPHEIGVGGAIEARYRALEAAGIVLQEWGWCVANEQQAHVVEQDGRTVNQRTVQRFERGWRIYQPGETGEWKVVAPLLGQQVIPLERGAT